MTAYTVSIEQLPPLFKEWSKRFPVYVPAKEASGYYNFVPWTPDIEVAWDYDVAYNSLKRFFFPPKETLISFDVETCTAKPVFEAPPQLLFGVHPYDLRAINQLDQIMEMGAPDYNYMRRREATLIFAMEPTRIAENAFWSSMGAGDVDHGFDLYWTKISASAFYVEALSPRGEEFIQIKGAPPKATLMEREAAKRERVRVRNQSSDISLDYPWKNTPKLLARNWNSPLWRKKAAKCLSCGSCVLVCPTCYCFEVREEVDLTLKAGVRFREWHGCMLPSFQAVAGGHNFWPIALERYRHRYFRKGKYIYDKIGELGCVGCGRCVRACTAGIANPMAVYNELWEAEHHES